MSIKQSGELCDLIKTLFLGLLFDRKPLHEKGGKQSASRLLWLTLSKTDFY